MSAELVSQAPFQVYNLIYQQAVTTILLLVAALLTIIIMDINRLCDTAVTILVDKSFLLVIWLASICRLLSLALSLTSEDGLLDDTARLPASTSYEAQSVAVAVEEPQRNLRPLLHRADQRTNIISR